MHAFRLNKLVRDNFIERVEPSGVNINYRILDDNEYVLSLKEKLVEEALEVLEAKNIKDVREELCDLTEVIDALTAALRLSDEDMKNTRAEKADRSGAFKKRIYIESVSNVNEDDAKRYFSNSSKYPRISDSD